MGLKNIFYVFQKPSLALLSTDSALQNLVRDLQILKILTLIVKHYSDVSVLFRMIQMVLDNFHFDSFYSKKLSDLIWDWK